LSLWHCWRFKSSGMWSCIIRSAGPRYFQSTMIIQNYLPHDSYTSKKTCISPTLLSLLPTQNATRKTESTSLLLWKQQVHHFICNISPLDPILNINPVNTHKLFLTHTHTHLNINSPCMLSLPFRFPDLNVACLRHLFHACYMLFQASPSFANIRGLYWTVEIMTFLIKQFPVTSCHFPTPPSTLPLTHQSQGQVSIVPIVICYGLDTLWLDPRWGAKPALAPTSLQQWVGVHQPAHGTDYPLPSGSRVKIVRMYLHSYSVPSWHVMWRISPFYPIFKHLQSVLVH